MITADPNTYLGYVCKKVDDMKPGEWLTLDCLQLSREISSYHHNGAEFTPPDRILGNIVGSAYTHSFDIDPHNHFVTFKRHKETGQRYYMSPDWRVRSDR